MDRQLDGRTDRPSYRDAWMYLKKWKKGPKSKKKWETVEKEKVKDGKKNGKKENYRNEIKKEKEMRKKKTKWEKIEGKEWIK